MRFAFGLTVILVRRGSIDAYGDVTEGVEFAVSGCALSPRSGSSGVRHSRESVDFRGDVQSRMYLIAPPGTDIRATDEVILPSGERWQVDGESTAPYSPFTGWRPGVQAPLRKVTG